MSYPQDQIEEIKRYCTAVSQCQEGNLTYYLLEGLALPEGCSPPTCDALLSPMPRGDGYNSRLFFAQPIQSRFIRNWNASGVRVCERNWHAFSWRVERPDLRLAEILVEHLKGFTRQV